MEPEPPNMSLIIWPFAAFLISAFFYFGNLALSYLSKSWVHDVRRAITIHVVTGALMAISAVLWLIGSLIVLLQQWAENSPPFETSTITL